jgi:hypothetical protein
MIAQCPGCRGWMLAEQMIKRSAAGATVRVCSAACGARDCGLPPRDPRAAAAAALDRWFALPSPPERHTF